MAGASVARIALALREALRVEAHRCGLRCLGVDIERADSRGLTPAFPAIRDLAASPLLDVPGDH